MRGKTQIPYPKYMRNPDNVIVFEVFGSSLRISCFLNEIYRVIKEGKTAIVTMILDNDSKVPLLKIMRV